MDELDGVHTVIEALEVIDEWPPQAIEFLGLMAEVGRPPPARHPYSITASAKQLTPRAGCLLSQGGRADSVLRHGGLAKLLKALRDSLDHDADMAATAVLAIGRALGHTSMAREQVLPKVRRWLRLGRGGGEGGGVAEDSTLEGFVGQP